MSTSKKVIINTAALYLKLFISIFVAFITARLVLNALGEVDYGINSLVAGVIGMLAFLQTTISSASIRYLAINLGSNDTILFQKTINSSLLIHVIIGLIIILIIEGGGVILFTYFLNIPQDRINDAWIVFHLMVLTTYISIISVPFDAILNAYEEFIAISIIDTIGVLISLLIAYFIYSYSGNRLIVYATLTTLNQLLIRIIKQIYIVKKFPQLKFSFLKLVDKLLIRKMIKFAGWKTLDAGASVMYIQFKGVLLNMFFGVVINAANGIASNLTMTINNFSVNLTTAINPQLYKSEGSGNRNRMIRLTKVSAKYSLFIFALFSLPIIFETPFILTVWLENVPEYSAAFIRLILIEMLIQKLTHPLTTAFQAVNRIKEITIVVFLNLILQLVTVYILFLNDFSATSIYSISIIGSLISSFFRLYFGKKLLNLDINDYFKNVIAKGLTPIIISLIVGGFITCLLQASYLRLIITVLSISLTLLMSIKQFGLHKDEWNMVKSIFMHAFNKLKILKDYVKK